MSESEDKYHATGRAAAVDFATATLAVSRAHAFPCPGIMMAPRPFTDASLLEPPGPAADVLKADLEQAVEVLLAELGIEADR
jgi:hypothetical protein